MPPRSEIGSPPDPELESGQSASALPEAVCHRLMTGDLVYVPRAEFHGQTIYFCTETCQSVFLSDPERFYAAHGKRRNI
ncbi:MAG TPA: hypothetical protein VII93_07965 [Anaerolineales bacterium]